jgi:hypothetical protein
MVKQIVKVEGLYGQAKNRLTPLFKNQNKANNITSCYFTLYHISQKCVEGTTLLTIQRKQKFPPLYWTLNVMLYCDIPQIKCDKKDRKPVL